MSEVILISKAQGSCPARLDRRRNLVKAITKLRFFKGESGGFRERKEHFAG